MSLEKITKHVAEKLDEVYMKASVTSVLEGNSSLIQELDAETIKVPKVSTQGMADYDRANGYVAGTMSLTWEAKQLTNDRGREFSIDRADNLETAGVAYANLASTYTRVNVVPEMDALRFAVMSANAGTKVASVTLDNTSIVSALGKAIEQMDDDNVPNEDRVLFVSNESYRFLKESAPYRFGSGENLDRTFETFDDIEIIKVPKTRFYTAITLLDGTTAGQEAGGYTVSVTGEQINFMLVHKSAVIPYVGFNVAKAFAPEQNQKTDGYLFQQRIYHDCWVLDNKVAGIYVHSKEIS